jgi:hypothetical protein
VLPSSLFWIASTMSAGGFSSLVFTCERQWLRVRINGTRWLGEISWWLCFLCSGSAAFSCDCCCQLCW